MHGGQFQREKASEKLTVWQNFLLEYKNLFFNKPITCHVLPYIKIYIVIRQPTLHFPRVKCSPLFHFLHGNRSIYLKTIIIIIWTLEVFFSLACIYIHTYFLNFSQKAAARLEMGNRKHVYFLVGILPTLHCIQNIMQVLHLYKCIDIVNRKTAT